MKTALAVFINALERDKKQIYLTRTYITPLAKPAYKNVGIELYRKDESPTLLITTESTFKVTTDKEKEEAILKVTEELILKILKNYETI